MSKRTVMRAGSKFGLLTLIGKYGYKNKKEVLYSCKCTCGAIIHVTSNALRDNVHKSCKDCVEAAIAEESIKKTIIKDDLVGKTLGGWKIDKFGDRIKSFRHYEATCVECGNKQEVNGSSIKLHRCVKCKVCKAREQKSNAWNYIWNSTLEGAKSRNLEVTITRDFIIALLEEQNYICKLSGVKLVIADSSHQCTRGNTTASLDRIDSSKGYTSDNVQWIHKKLNTMKMALPNEDFISWCKLVAAHNTPTETAGILSGLI